MGLIRKAAFIGAGVYIGKHLNEKEENIKAAARYAQGQQQFPPQGQQQYPPQQQQQYQPQGQQNQHAPQGHQRQPPAYVARDQGYEAPMQAEGGFQNRDASGYQPEGGAFRDEKAGARK
ncbi:hypothetical protein VE00_10607 [Pseudogymnoascus sp. WSF 3629]|nr:hypothetical protein VE00_10607 [Pseudogymnoascus sp. WSF 3629]